MLSTTLSKTIESSKYPGTPMENVISDLEKLPNIGNVLAEKLSLAGILDAAHLKGMGAEKAFLRLRVMDNEACLNTLFAVEGAIQGIRWHELNKERKEALRDFFRMLNR